MAKGLRPKHLILSQGGQCSPETTSLTVSELGTTVVTVLDRDEDIRQAVAEERWALLRVVRRCGPNWRGPFLQRLCQP